LSGLENILHTEHAIFIVIKWCYLFGRNSMQFNSPLILLSMKKPVLLTLLAVVAILMSCTNNASDVSSTSRDVSVFLTDAPQPNRPDMPCLRYLSVNLDVKAIQYIGKDSIWKDATFTEAVYNIKMLANGDSALLSKINIPAGEVVRHIRFVLGKNNTVVLADKSVKQLNILAKSDSSIVVKAREVVPAGNYSIMLDFDIARSIIRDRNGNYILIPKMRGFIMQCTGSIEGFVLPNKLLTKVFVVNGTDTISTLSDTIRHNYFKMSGFVDGTYTVQFMPIDSGRVTLTKSVTLKGREAMIGQIKVIK
jgi:hypothetical protein